MLLYRKLPQSYRNFILVWGPGEFGTCVRITAPGYSDCGDTIDLKLMHSDFEEIRRDETLWLDGCDDPELFRRLVVFGNNAATGDKYCWDPADVREPEENEYAIYELIHGYLRTPMFVAGSFREFIMQRAIDPPNPIDEYYVEGEDDTGGDMRYFNHAFPPLRMSDLAPQDRLVFEYAELYRKVSTAVCKYARSKSFEGTPPEVIEQVANLSVGVVIHLNEGLREIPDRTDYTRLPTPEEIQEFLTWREEHKDEFPW